MCLANSFSSVEQIGQTDVEVESEFELEEVYAEWQDGVFSADNPAERAMCRSGRDGRESSSWWVRTNKSARCAQRSEEYISYAYLLVTWLK